MAQQDQGIMALPATGAAPQEPSINMREFRRQAYPVAKDAVREVAPEAYGEMQALLSSELAAAGDLDPEGVEQLLEIVDYINDHPEEYPQIRAALIKEGVIDEGDFPAEMDVEYFATMQAVLEEAAAQQRGEAAQIVQGPTGMAPPQGFAKGGIAEAAQLVASRGRYGDTMLAHITPSEARLLKARGGSGTINPETGLPEFFLKKAFKAVTKTVKSVAKAVGGVVKKVAQNPIGRIVLTVGLTMVGVPAPIAAGLVTKAGGGTWKDALKSAAVAYLASPGGPIGSYVSKATPFLNNMNPHLATGLRSGITGTGAALLTGSNLKSAVAQGVTAGVSAGLQSYVKGTPAPGENRTTQDGMNVRSAGDGLAPEVSPGTPAPGADIGPGQDISGTFNPSDAAAGAANVELSPAEFAPQNIDMGMAPTAGPAINMASGDPTAGMAAIDNAQITPNYSDMPTSSPFPEPTYPVSTADNPNPWANPGDPGPSLMDRAKSFFSSEPVGEDAIREPSLWDKTKEMMYPSDPTDAQIAERAAEIKGDYASRGINISDTAAVKAASGDLTPGMIRQYGPMTAATLGTAYLAGAFEVPEDEPDRPDNADEIEKPIEVPEELQTPMQNLPGVVYDSAGNIIGSKPWNPYGGQTAPTSVETPSALAPYKPYDPNVPTQGIAGLSPFTPPTSAPFPFTPAENAPSPLVPTPGVGGTSPGGTVATPGAPVSGEVPTPGVQQQPSTDGMFLYQQPYTAPQPYMTQQPYQRDPRDPATLYYMQNPYAFQGTYGQRVQDTPRYYKNGGIAALAQGGYPRRIGQISGPGTETSDDIPAMLSDGEFVMTARAVRGAGGGSRRDGAKKMYALMHQLEKNAARG